MPKVRTRTIVIASLALVMVVAGLFAYWQSANRPASRETTVSLGQGSGKAYKLETVETSADQGRGLSGRAGLPADGGMLFEYGGTGEQCIWMKDMKFSIDVIWLDESGRIVSAVSGMKPESYPQKYCALARRVIELPAGTIRQQGLRPGQVVDL